MSGDVQMELWLHEYKMAALASVLKEQGSTVEERMQAALFALYEEQVPQEVQEKIRTRIDAEHAAERAAGEAARKHTAFRVRENRADSFFQLDGKEDILEVAKFLRRYLREEQGQAVAALQKSAFAGMKPVTAEQYEQLTALRMEDPSKVTGVFDLDFDRQMVSTVDAIEGWKTYSIQDVSAAVYHAYRKGHLKPEQYISRFLDKLDGKELTSAGHLSAQDISFADEICEVDNLLNFYMESRFDADALLGTHVCTTANDDWINIYVNYDMTAGQVCDTLEIILHREDGSDKELSYPLNAVEKAALLRKMDAYCQQQTGQSLTEYSAQLMAEDMTHPTGPVMEVSM